MKKTFWVSDLPTHLQTNIQDEHRQRLIESGIYTQEEIDMFVNDILNEKIGNIEESISEQLYNKIKRN